MRAILLAAGFGTRLRPLTDTTPKCLVPVKGEPLLGNWLRRLSAAGIGPFLVNTHYLAEQVEAFVESSQFAQRITLVHEPELLGTAGTLIANLDFFGGEDGMLIHADNYCLSNLARFVDAHRHRPIGCVMTMLTFRTDDPSSCGVVEIDERGVVVGFHEKTKSPPGNLANGAVYILSPELQGALRSVLRGATDFSTQVLPCFVGSIHTYESGEVFYDVGTPEAYARANAS